MRGFVCPMVRRSVRWSVTLEVKNQKTRIYEPAVGIVCVGVLEGVWGGVWVRLWVGCLCPTAHNGIVTPRHLFSAF